MVDTNRYAMGRIGGLETRRVRVIGSGGWFNGNGSRRVKQLRCFAVSERLSKGWDDRMDGKMGGWIDELIERIDSVTADL